MSLAVPGSRVSLPSPRDAPDSSQSTPHFTTRFKTSLWLWGQRPREPGPGPVGRQKSLFAQVRSRERSQPLGLSTALTPIGRPHKTVPASQPTPHPDSLWSQNPGCQVFLSVTPHLPPRAPESVKQRKPRSVTCPCLGPAPWSAARAPLPTTLLSPEHPQSHCRWLRLALLCLLPALPGCLSCLSCLCLSRHLSV